MYPIHAAVSKGNLSLSRMLLQRHADASVVDFAGNTILHYACHQKNSEFLDFLFGFQLNVNQSNSEGSTALHLAAQAGNDLLVKELIQRGGVMEALDGVGLSANDWARIFGYNPIAANPGDPPDETQDTIARLWDGFAPFIPENAF
eukprot:TRINITY_DN6192_c0_g1_i3.p1 TRINITY_DN6192_c0_g1~~TRINITY_DN6192_c0_g1_i3.p1  ORF type:complete len:146 (+),score=31.20 TRINITY_DN6192_c0_g1_i3:577-1014(+)